MSAIRNIFRISAVTIGGSAALFTGLFLASANPPPVLATVVQDASLPAIEVNNVRLQAKSFGPSDGPVIVAMHGGPGRILVPCCRSQRCKTAAGSSSTISAVRAFHNV